MEGHFLHSKIPISLQLSINFYSYHMLESSDLQNNSEQLQELHKDAASTEI